MHQVTIVPFGSEVVPTFDVSQSPLEVFLNFWPDHFLQQISNQTNLYAKQVMGPAKYADWVELSVPESLLGALHSNGDSGASGIQ